jgi:hypothetical protein
MSSAVMKGAKNEDVIPKLFPNAIICSMVGLKVLP